jgi:hypothetical protein
MLLPETARQSIPVLLILWGRFQIRPKRFVLYRKAQTCNPDHKRRILSGTLSTFTGVRVGIRFARSAAYVDRAVEARLAFRIHREPFLNYKLWLGIAAPR